MIKVAKFWVLFSYLENQSPAFTKHEAVKGFLGAVTGLAPLPGLIARGYFGNSGSTMCILEKNVVSCLLLPASRARAWGGGVAYGLGQWAEEGGIPSGKCK